MCIEHPWTAAFDILNFDSFQSPQVHPAPSYICWSRFNHVPTYCDPFLHQWCQNTMSLRYFGRLHRLASELTSLLPPISGHNVQQQHFRKRKTSKGTKWDGYKANVAPAAVCTSSGVDLHRGKVYIPMVVLALPHVVRIRIASKICCLMTSFLRVPIAKAMFSLVAISH